MNNVKNVSFGVYIADDPQGIGPGWASVAGNTPLRVNGLNELPQDVYWVTNLGYKAYRSLNVNKLPHVFDEQYFRSSIKNISQEVGLSGKGEELSRFCSLVFTNAFKYASEVTGKPVPIHPYRFFSGISDVITPKAARRNPAHSSGHKIRRVTTESTQANQSMFGVRAPMGSTPLPFVIPRHNYFEWMARQPIPTCENWRIIKDETIRCTIGKKEGKILKGTRAALRNLVEMGSSDAIFLKITVKSTDPFFKSFATFGAGASYPRGYASLPEILNLSRYSEIKIEGGFKCGLMLMGELGLSFGGDEHRYSKGLALENIFAGLANPPGGSKANGFNAINAYLRAYDRIICQRHAEEMARAGLVIGSFGSGKILVYCKSHEAELIREVARESIVHAPIALGDEDDGF